MRQAEKLFTAAAQEVWYLMVKLVVTKLKARASTLVLAALSMLLPASSPVAARPQATSTTSPSSGSLLFAPDFLVDENGRTVEVEQGLLFVPENRARVNSRMIGVHFTRFPPIRASIPERPPVFLFPGGPGWDFDFSDPLYFDEVERLRQTRAVIAVSQRGYSGAPGLVPNFRVAFEPISASSAMSGLDRARRDRGTLLAAFQKWDSRGIDLAGYDIVNITDDINDLRRALGYDKIILRGCSFGSQWSLAYMQRWPETVDRALLSGVEPLAFGYDSPDWLWASMARVAAAAESDPGFAPSVPPGGLMHALTVVIERLEAAPVTVKIRSPSEETDILVPIAADDLRGLLTSLSLNRRRALENLGQWPRFIVELYNGDYRFLAVRVAQDRMRDRSESLILSLINRSVGVTSSYARGLQKQAAARWLGDINLKESVTRSVAPTREVDNAFRADHTLTIPTLMIAGDYDWSTPIENAEHLSQVLPISHLVRIAGGRHCTETNFGELSAQLPEEIVQIYSFIDADLVKSDPSEVLSTFPQRLSLGTIGFTSTGGASLYNEWLANRR